MDTATAAPMGPPGLPDGMPALSSLYLYISGACNLACRHCWVQPDPVSESAGPYLKVEWVEAALQQAAGLGLQSVKLTGGEPLLHPGFTRILDLLEEAGVSAHIETNGTLIDRAMAAALKGHACIGSVAVSLDGAAPDTHERLRGVPGSFQRAVAGIERLAQQGMRPQLICTVHQGNRGEIRDLLLLAEKLGCGSVKLNQLQTAGRGARFARRSGLGVQAYVALFREIENHWASLVSIPVHVDIPPAFYSIRTLLEDAGRRCTVRNILGVLATGELSLCGIGATVPEMVFGHIDTDDLRAVWCRHPMLEDLRSKVPARLDGICGACLHRGLCQGFCVAANYLGGGCLEASHAFCREAYQLGIFPESRIRPSLPGDSPETENVCNGPVFMKN